MPHAYLNAPHLHVFQFCGKVVFTQRQAKLKARHSNNGAKVAVKAGTGTMNAYRCPICWKWHIGHLVKGNEKIQ